MKARQLFCMFLCICFALVLLPINALAAQGNDLVVTGGTLGTDYTYNSNGILSFTNSGDYTVQMADGITETTDDKIVVSGGTEANPVNIKLSGVTIKSNTSAFRLSGSAYVILTLEEGTSNHLRGYFNYAGLHVPIGTTLTIDGTGSLIAEGGGAGGAGIGGGKGGLNCGKVTVNGSKTTAAGGTYGAGIGGGYDTESNSGGAGGTVTINDGTVTASSKDFGAGIGGAYGGVDKGCSGGKVTINGGTVTATSTNGHGIGGGYGTISIGKSGTCTITAGSVKVSSMGPTPTNGSIPIYSTTVKLAGTANTDVTCAVDDSAGFVCATNESNEIYPWLTLGAHNLFITDSTYSYVASLNVSNTNKNAITANDLSSTNVSITSSGTYVLTGTTSENAITVNAGTTEDPVNITLNGVDIDQSVGGGCALKLQGNSRVNLTLADGTTNSLVSEANYAGLEIPINTTATIGGTGSLTATSNGGAGIGGGCSGDGGTVNISGGTVTATGSNGSAGIGGGHGGNGGTVNISGGTVIATGSGGGAGIGGGHGSNGGTVYISGGTVKATGSDGADNIGVGFNGANNGTLQNNSIDKTDIYLTTVTLDGILTKKQTTSLTVALSGSTYVYGINDMHTDTSGDLYLYLPVDATTRTAQAGGNNYSGSVVTKTDEATSSGRLFLSQVSTLSPSGAGTALDGDIEITFSMEMDTSVSGTISLGGTNLSGGEWSSGNTVYTIPYSGLSFSTEYCILVSNFKDKNNNTVPMARGSFTTEDDTYAPIVTEVSPDGAGAAISGNIVVTFNEAMDNTTVGTVSLDGNMTTLAGGSWSDCDTKYTIPYSALSYSTQYTISISGFKDAAGNEMTEDNNNSFNTTHYPYCDANDPEYELDITTSGETITVTATIKTKLYSDRTLNISITENIINRALEKILEEHGEYTTKVLEIAVDRSDSATGFNINIPADALATMTASFISRLKITTPLGNFFFDAKTLKLIKRQATGDISLSIAAIDASSLPAITQMELGDRPVYSFTVSSGDTVISDFSGETITVSLPYTLVEGEDTDNIVIYYISDSGKLIMVPDCVYDPESGMVTFMTSHFSVYAVGYNCVSFTDVSGWYENYVDFVAARGLMNGIGYRSFAPSCSMTRAMFVTVLYRLSGDTGSYTNTFSDVPSGTWYEDAVAWGKVNGIIIGVGGNCFAPNAEISREQLTVMLYNYANYKGCDVSVGEDTNILSFNDVLDISDYAYPALQWVCGVGILEGDDKGNLNPVNSASRVEAAAILQRFIKYMII